VWVRPVEDTDVTELQRAFELLSDLSRYRRFLTGTPRLNDKIARYFTDVDHVDHEALVALPAERSHTIVGVARYVRSRRNPAEADLAVTVADLWHGRGLGTALLDRLSARAAAEGIERFTVDMLADNTAVRALVAGAGGRTGGRAGALVSAQIELAPVVVPLSPRQLIRAAASGRVAPVPEPLASLVPELRPAVRGLVPVGLAAGGTAP
jgi:acetyltransferase